MATGERLGTGSVVPGSSLSTLHLTRSMTTLPAAIDSSRRLTDFIIANLGERAEAVTVNGVLAITLHSISLDHREATLLLVDAGAFTSSRAVARSCLEAYVTASWAEHIASEDDVRKFMRSERPAPSFETMAQRLRKSHPWGELFEKLRSHYKTLSDYAHGSTRQVSRWVSPDCIGPRHAEAEMVEVLRFVDAIGVLACISRESISSRAIEPFTTKLDDVLQGRA